MKTGSFIASNRHFKNLPHHEDWGGINYEMQTGKIIEYQGKKGIVIQEQPRGLITCLFGSECKREMMNVKPSKLALLDFTDLTPTECEALLPLMQALVFRLMDDKKAF